MAYDEETKRSRVVVETPSARREVTRTEREYAPPRDGMSTATVTVLVVLGVAVVGLLLLLFMNMQSNQNNANLAAQQPTPQTTIVQQPAQQPPVIVQQPAPATQQPPIIVNPPASGMVPATAPNTPSVPDDGSIQAAIDKKFHNDSLLSTLDVTTTVTNGKVLLVGTVKSEQLKNQVEKAVRSIKGVKSVDNQIVVAG
jgi:flagellar basal body-associated protein FliL